jgi:PAS domain S-box-containing protein
MVEDKINRFVKKDFQIVDAYAGTTAIKRDLIRHSALVVRDEDLKLLGVLTPLDIIQRPHNLVIDCLSPKTAVPPDCTIEKALMIMQEEQWDVLPVHCKDCFEGLVFKEDLLRYVKQQKEYLNNKVNEKTSMLTEANSNLRASKKILNALFDSTQSVIFVVSPNYEIMFFNRLAYISCLRLYQKKLKKGENFQDYFAGQDNSNMEAFKNEFDKTLNGENIATEKEIAHPDGSSTWVRLEFYPVNEDGSLIGVALSFTNINNQKAYEAHIKEQNRIFKGIAWVLSHKTRQPLASLLGLLNILNKNDLSDYNKEVVELMEDTAKKLDIIIRSTVIKANSAMEDEMDLNTQRL